MIYKHTDCATDRFITQIHPLMTFSHQGHKYTVDEVYPYNAKCIRDDGRIESFSLGDFVMKGMEESEPNENNCKGIKFIYKDNKRRAL